MIAILIAALCVLIVVLIAVLVGAADTVHHHKTDAAHYRQLYDDAASITPNRIGCSILTLLGVMFFFGFDGIPCEIQYKCKPMGMDTSSKDEVDETIREMELGGWSKGSLVGNNARNSDVAQQLEAACAEVERLQQQCHMLDRIESLQTALANLEDAADPFAADQSRAPDPRCGLVQPVTVADCEALTAAIRAARCIGGAANGR